MPDNKSKIDGRDDAKVDGNDRSEVEYIHQLYPSYTHQQIIEVIKKYGPLRKDIVAHLKNES